MMLRQTIRWRKRWHGELELVGRLFDKYRGLIETCSPKRRILGLTPLQFEEAVKNTLAKARTNRHSTANRRKLNRCGHSATSVSPITDAAMFAVQRFSVPSKNSIDAVEGKFADSRQNFLELHPAISGEAL